MPDLDRYQPIADYALLSDCHSAALVSRRGSVDWACLRRFDANSVFARILDHDRGGFFSVCPVGPAESSRAYVGDSLVLETRFDTDEGAIRLLDAFSMHEGGELDPHNHLLRIVEGIAGEVEIEVEIEPRFDFGEVRPLLRHHGETGAYSATGGDTALVISSDGPLDLDDGRCRLSTRAVVREGERMRFSIECQAPSELDPRRHSDREMDDRMDQTIEWWHGWSSQITSPEEHADLIRRSAVVLKGLTCGPTGALVAAPTTSLPEAIGGERNWDYRYAWIRDASLVVAALAETGKTDSAQGFRDFLLRSAGGSPQDLRIMYGLDGSRHLPEHTIDLEGYRGSRPVRVGNHAYGQVQHDVCGQLLDLAHLWHTTHQRLADHEWQFLRGVVDWATEIWQERDAGIWEIRSEPKHFVHSKAMLWAAVDRGVHLVEDEGFDGDADRWRRTREQIAETVDERGVRNGHFVQAYDTDEVDAALLALPMIGMVAAGDPRMIRTVERIQEDLTVGPDGFLCRYRPEHVDDGVGGEEGVFLMCSFWLVDVLAMQGRLTDAEELFDRLLSVGNDLGLFAEQYDPDTDELLGNFPQAFTHMAIINSAHHLACARGDGAQCREEPWATADRLSRGPTPG